MPPTYANGHISATGDPIHFMFGSRVGFSGTADRTALFTVRTNPRWRPPPCWKHFKWRYLRNRSSDPLHVLFYAGVFGNSGSNGDISGSNKCGKISNGHISATCRIGLSPQRLTIYLYSAHRAVISAIAQLSCLSLSLNISKSATDTAKVIILDIITVHQDQNDDLLV